jgi:hypothetical protein
MILAVGHSRVLRAILIAVLTALGILVLVGLGAPLAGAQGAAPAPGGPAIGDAAPDFTLPGATRYGLLRDPVSLSSLKGKTVVLAFFFKARTRG